MYACVNRWNAAQVASAKNYSQWLVDNLFTVEDWVKASKVKVPAFNFDETNRRLNMFGYTVETLDILLYPMGKYGDLSYQQQLCDCV